MLWCSSKEMMIGVGRMVTDIISIMYIILDCGVHEMGELVGY